MLLVFTTTLPLFVLILAGYVSARRGLIDQGGIRGLTGFVFYFTLPLTLFHMMATAPVAERFDSAFVGAYLFAALALQAAGIAIARWGFGHRLDEQAVQGMAASFGNLVFIALPIALELFGEAAALPILLLLLVENGVILPLTIALLELARSERGPAWRAPAVAGLAIVRNPVIMSVLAGAAVALAGLSLPDLLDGVVKFVKGANVPCALFALGATLATMPRGERLREADALVVLKLAAYPAMVYVRSDLARDRGALRSDADGGQRVPHRRALRRLRRARLGRRSALDADLRADSLGARRAARSLGKPCKRSSFPRRRESSANAINNLLDPRFRGDD